MAKLQGYEYVIHFFILLLLSTSMPLLIVFGIIACRDGVEFTWMRAFNFLKEVVDEIDQMWRKET